VRIAFAVVVFGVLFLSYVSHVPSQPSFNGTTPGCGGGGCHTFQAGIASVTPKANLQLQVSLSGASGNVAGELVDSTGAVVAVVDLSNNPLTLAAPRAGRYTVNAGYKSPSRRWDSVQVSLTLTDVLTQGEEMVGDAFKLDQNYPNPFNPATSIGYTLARESRVKLEVYNTIGELVSTLVEKNQEAGTYSIRYDMSGLASGVYVYRIVAADLQSPAAVFTQTRKMLLMK